MRARPLATRTVAIAAAVVAVLVVDVRPAAAQVGWGLQDDSAITAGATDPGSSPATAQVSRRRRGVAMCTAADGTVGRVGYEPVPAELLIDEQKAQVAEGGGIYWKTCGGQTQLKYSGTGNGGIYVPPRTRGGPPANPGDLAEEALERTPLPEPVIEMAPRPEFTQLVNLPVFLWLGPESWKTFTASASAGPVTSTVTATPKRVIWDMGTGDTVVCDGPGLPYDPALSDEANPSTCRYTYRRSSAGQPDQAFVVTATLEWETTWSVTGAAGGGGLGTVARSSSTKVTVAELQALNIYDRP
jgi:hypothetical protein